MAVEAVRRLPDVFGVSREVPLTYVSRPYVDERLVNSLTRDKHIVVYGGSKQGKTCLRKQCLNDSDYLVVQCGNNSSRDQIYSAILKETGASVDQTTTVGTTGTNKVKVQFEGEGGLPLIAKAKGAIEGEHEGTKETSVTKTSFEIDPSDANDVIRILRDIGFTKYIVLEDFHYLSEDVQKEIAIDLKAFHEKSNLCFIIVGVWLETNRLVLYNGDLSGRLVSINADEWNVEHLRAVIEAGEPLLNVGFHPEVVDTIIELSQNNVGLLQETCYKLCEDASVYQTQPIPKAIESVDEVRRVVLEIANEQAGRYHNFIQEFIQGFQATELDMYRWIVFAILCADISDLKRGLKLAWIYRLMNEVHPKRAGGLYHNNVLQTLKNVQRLQHKKKIQPIVIDFDANENELNVVDTGFILYLNSQNRESIIEQIGCKEAFEVFKTLHLEGVVG